jgi:hypothetical protein
MSGLLFPEMTLHAGDVIDSKGARIYSKDVYKGLLFVKLTCKKGKGCL